MESKNLNLNKPENFESKTGDIVGMSFDITGPTSADTTPIMDIDNTTPLFRNTPSTNKSNMLIGDDGKLYPTPEALEDANKTYWENWKKINESGRTHDLSHLKALDGSYHSNPESIKEANKKFREAYMEQMVNLNRQRTELINQLLANPNYALECAGIKFIQQVYQIDPLIIQKMLILMLDATRNGDFESLETKFIDMLYAQAEIKQNGERLR